MVDPGGQYAARLRGKAYLPGRLAGCVDVIDAFFPTCREPGGWLLHTAVYSRIEAKSRSLEWLQRLTAGIYGEYMGYRAMICRFESVQMGIYGAFALPCAAYARIHPIMQQPLSSKSTCRQKSVYNVDT